MLALHGRIELAPYSIVLNMGIRRTPSIPLNPLSTGPAIVVTNEVNDTPVARGLTNREDHRERPQIVARVALWTPALI